MSHYPLNHPLRPVYRVLSALAGLYLTLFGLIGLGVTWGDGFVNRGHDWVLGLRTNPAQAWLAALVGIILLTTAVIGGNLHHHAALVIGWGLCGLAVLSMAFIQTDANILDVSMVNVVVLLLIGVIVLSAGLYTKVGSPEAARAEDSAAHPR